MNGRPTFSTKSTNSNRSMPDSHTLEIDRLLQKNTQQKPAVFTPDSSLNGLDKAEWKIISVSKYMDPNLGLRACVTAKIRITPRSNSYKSGN
jgi:hypothetical protein